MGLLSQGRSFSGRERNCMFMNCGSDRFANISSASGLDFSDDGRSLAVVDWDHDGDLDLWLHNRTGPRLRLMRNETNTSDHRRSFVTFKLRGTRCNRDAIGARVEITLEDPSRGRLIQTLYAGEGFMSQSSKWLHFGLGEDPQIKLVTVRWPSGESESFSGILPGRRYLLEQASSQAVEWQPAKRSLKLATSTQPTPKSSGVAQALLPKSFAMPSLPYAVFDDPLERPVDTQGMPLLVNLWASWCMPCQVELKMFRDHESALRRAGLNILSLSVDGIGEDKSTTPGDAKTLLDQIGFPFDSGIATVELLKKIEVIQDFLFSWRRPINVPMSLLLDAQGRLAAIYHGPVAVDRLLRDVVNLTVPLQQRLQLAIPFSGRWNKKNDFDSQLDKIAELFVNQYPKDAVRYLKWELERQSLRPPVATMDEHLQKKRNEELAEVYFSMAYAMHNLNLPRQSQEILRQVIQLAPDHAKAHKQLAVLLETQQRTDEAMGYYRRAIEIDGDLGAAHTGLGKLLRLKGKPDEAAQHLGRALQIDPKDADAHHQLGRLLVSQSKLEEAIESYQRAIDVDSTRFVSHNALGVAQAAQKKFREAIKSFEAAMRLNPEFVDAYNNLGSVFSEVGHLDEAIAFFLQALQINPDYARAHYNLGKALKDKGQTEGALEHFVNAAELNSKWWAPLNYRSWILATHPDDQVRDGREAIRLAQRAANLLAHSNSMASMPFVAVQDTLAAAYAEAGQFHQATATIEQAISMLNNLGRRAMVLELQGRLNLYQQQIPYRELAVSGNGGR